MNKQKILKKYLKKSKEKFKNSEYLSKYGLYVPSYYNLKKKETIPDYRGSKAFAGPFVLLEMF